MKVFNCRLTQMFALFAIFAGFVSTASAQEVVSQSINLAPGWHIVSTPKILESHEFSAPETSDNFDIYVLDSSRPTGWATMADLNQSEFTPLFGYFVNNKTEGNQVLTLNYDVAVPPNEKLFERTFDSPGWYSIGVANSEFAIESDGLYGDTNNPNNILSLLNGSFDLFVDFTDAEYLANRQSVALSEPWNVALPDQINSVNDLRETKGYVLYITEAGARYNGLQAGGGSQSNPGGAPIELKVVGANENNQPRVISVYENNGAVDENILLFSVENESGTNVTLDSFSIELITSGVDVNEYVKSLYAEAAQQIWIPIASSSSNIEVGGDSATVIFEDFNLEIDAWEQATVRVRVDTYPLGGNFDEGDTLTVTTNPTQVGWSSFDEFTNLIDRSYGTGGAEGGPYTAIFGYPIVIPADSFNSETDTLGQNDTIGEFTLEFEVTALEDDFYITDNSASTSVDNGVKYSVEGGDAVITSSLSSTADEDTNGVFTVREGETETFILVVSVDPVLADTFRVTLDEVWYSENTDGFSGEAMYLIPASDFRTSYQTIQGS